jgi:hypothetical protein
MAASSGPLLITCYWDIENARFSIWTVEGMASRRADRSECGLDGCYRVGAV